MGVRRFCSDIASFGSRDDANKKRSGDFAAYPSTNRSTKILDINNLAILPGKFIFQNLKQIAYIDILRLVLANYLCFQSFRSTSIKPY